MNKKYVVESITVNGTEGKIVKAKSGGLELEGDVLDFGALAVKLPSGLFDSDEGNEIKFVMRKVQ